MLESGVKWVVLGDMLELGVFFVSEYVEIVQFVKLLQLDGVILVGLYFVKVVKDLDLVYFNIVVEFIVSDFFK